MSGINPLIDTLMHQVLGRRGDAAPRVLNEPVRPVDPGAGPQALHSDSRLDGRADPRLSELRLPPSLDLPRQGGRGELPAGQQGSTQTHFSLAARSIADVLLRFPAPPSTLRAEAPLMQPTDNASPSNLAARLETSIRDSGLFYESHLKRWFQGDAARQQLLREPQMQPGVRPLPTVPLAGQGLPAISNPLSPNGPPLILPAAVPFTLPPGSSLNMVLQALGQSGGSPFIQSGSALLPAAGNVASQSQPASLMSGVHPVVSGNSSAANTVMQGQSGELGVGRELPELNAMRQREVVNESLQGLVRQQLELLVTPTIRWEGDVWAGIFMALVINLPGREEGASGDDSKQSESEEGWRSEMHLDVPELGEFSVALWFYRSTLSVDFTTPSSDVQQRLDDHLPALEQRLSALNLRKVQLKVRRLDTYEAL
ncbi:MAG: flagellar hook-length control protein FliK [Pseudomonadota bacterium]